jgi:hypothetical protein
MALIGAPTSHSKTTTKVVVLHGLLRARDAGKLALHPAQQRDRLPESGGCGHYGLVARGSGKEAQYNAGDDQERRPSRPRARHEGRK